MPDLGLLGHRQLLAVDFFELWLLGDAVELVVYAVEELAEKLLRILLEEAGELAGDAADLPLEVKGE